MVLSANTKSPIATAYSAKDHNADILFDNGFVLEGSTFFAD
jgi:hypothetical protein